MKLVCEKTLAGVTAVYVVTTPATGDQGLYVRAIVGAGNPFWIWDSLPPGKVIGADFTDAPICTSDTAANRALIAGITANPADVLFYAE